MVRFSNFTYIDGFIIHKKTTKKTLKSYEVLCRIYKKIYYFLCETKYNINEGICSVFGRIIFLIKISFLGVYMYTLFATLLPNFLAPRY